LQEEVFIADTHNHRIQVFEKNGTFLYEFGTAGKGKGELWYPRKIAVIKNNGNFVICDRGTKRSRMQVFTGYGHFVREISLYFIDIVSSLVITEDNNFVVVDSVKSTVFVISEFGDLLTWFSCSDNVIEPSDIAVWKRHLYICDFKGHSVAVYTEGGLFVRRIALGNITKFPNGIDISEEGDILIGDSHGNKFHIAVLSNDGLLLSEFECPHVKLSRCCGLKLTSEGYVISLAKNNHHALVLNTLYVH
jgi:sugar lactone lactonase YvrE